MNTLKIHEKLKSIPSVDLAETIGVSKHMAKKYRLSPGAHTPNIVQAEKIRRKYKIPFSFWINIKSYLQDNDTKHQDKKAMRRGAEC